MTPVEQIKERFSIVDVVSSYIKLEKAGINFKARCPFHHEKTASFFVSPNRNSFHCFGCSRGGDIFTFVQDIEGVNFSEALKILADKAGIDLTAYSGFKNSELNVQYRILEDAASFFESNLLKYPEAKKYLSDRGLLDKTIKDFRVGYIPTGWRNLLSYLKSKNYSEHDIEKTGLIIKTDKGYYDRFRSRIMFPIANSQSKIAGFSGRIFEAEIRKTPGVGASLTPGVEENFGAKYVNSPETELYNKSRILYGYDKAKRAIMQNNSAIIVEGQMDLIMAHQAGSDNAVAVSGTAMTGDHLELIKRFTENIVICFDADSAGFGASERTIKMALERDMDVKIAKLPEGMDPADLIIKDKNLWQHAIKNSKQIIDFYLAVLKEKNSDSRILGKEITKKVLPFVAEIRNNIDQAHFIKKIATELGVDEESVRQEIRKVSSVSNSSKEIKKETQEIKNMRNEIEDRAIGIILWQSDKTDPELDVLKAKEEFQRISGKIFDDIIKDISDSLKQNLIFQTEMYYKDSDSIMEILDELLGNLEKEMLEIKLKNLLKNLKKEESLKNESEVEKILKECHDISNRINEIKSKK